MADQRSVWNLLRTLLHGRGRPAPGSHQRASIFADAPSQLPRLCRSLQWRQPVRREILLADDFAGGLSASALALRTRLESERPEIVWCELALRSGLCRNHRSAVAKIYRGQPGGLLPG